MIKVLMNEKMIERLVGVWMDNKMNRLMDKRTERWLRCMNEQMFKWMYQEFMNEWMNEWINLLMKGWILIN